MKPSSVSSLTLFFLRVVLSMLGPVHFHVNFWTQLICVYISVGILESDFFFLPKTPAGLSDGDCIDNMDGNAGH